MGCWEVDNKKETAKTVNMNSKISLFLFLCIKNSSFLYHYLMQTLNFVAMSVLHRMWKRWSNDLSGKILNDRAQF